MSYQYIELTETQSAILDLLNDRGELSAKQIFDALKKTHRMGAIYPTIWGLADRGLIALNNANDATEERPKSAYRLTEMGRRAIE